MTSCHSSLGAPTWHLFPAEAHMDQLSDCVLLYQVFVYDRMIHQLIWLPLLVVSSPRIDSYRSITSAASETV